MTIPSIGWYASHKFTIGGVLLKPRLMTTHLENMENSGERRKKLAETEISFIVHLIRISFNVDINFSFILV